jgi:hypothetical protein
VFNRGGWRFAGESNARGVVELTDQTEVTQVVAKAEGFATTRLGLTDGSWNEPVRVVLAAGWSHCGRVVTASGGPPPPGLTVVATWIDGPSEGDARDRWMDGDPSLLRARVDESGNFCVSGLRSGGLYSLFCGGAGFVMTRPSLCRVDERSTGRTLEVGRLFGTMVLLEDERGSPVPLLGERIWEAWCPGGSATSANLTAVLAGLDIALLAAPDSTELLMFVSDSLEDTIGPVTLDHELAGYERGHAVLEAKAISQGIAQYRLQLQTTEPLRSVLHVRFDRRDHSPDLAGDRELARMGELELVEEDRPSARPLRFSLSIDDAGRVGALGVPLGTYRARYVSSVLRIPRAGSVGQRIDVTRTGAELELSLATSGGLKLDLRDRDGSAYEGLVRVDLLVGPPQNPGPGGRVRSVVAGSGNFRPPYRIEGLSPGEYTVSLSAPRFTGERGERLAVLVREGEEVVVSAWRAD